MKKPTSKTLQETTIDRCVAIENLVETTEIPMLSPTSNEDMDDAYQEKLEYGYWLDDLQTEYDSLRKILGCKYKSL